MKTKRQYQADEEQIDRPHRPNGRRYLAMAVWMIAKNQKPDLAEAVGRPGFSL